MFNQDSPIGVFDSGVGGISVLRVLRQDLPHEDFIFLGDSQNAPYGDKSISQIRDLSEKNLQFLLNKGVKAVVIACNTATSAAAEYLRERYPELIIVGMEPAVKPAAKPLSDRADSSLKKPEVLVLATSATIRGERLQHLINKHRDGANYHLLPAPEIVPFVESGRERSPELYQYLRELLLPYRLSDDTESKQKGISSPEIPLNSVVLGCTHFPFVKQAIQDVLGYPVQFFDGAFGTSRETRHRLEQAGLLRHSSEDGQVKLYSSSGSTELAERLLKLPF